MSKHHHESSDDIALTTSQMIDKANKDNDQKVYDHLMLLLSQLSALTDELRLKTLSDIDRVLTAEGLSWSDIAESIRLTAMAAADLLKTLEYIEQHPSRLNTSDKTRPFLKQLRERTTARQRVYLSDRQIDCLSCLYNDAIDAADDGEVAR
jgi:hypothetical protein